jgi:glycosyltransferase involved in cell wall biosynthesis
MINLMNGTRQAPRIAYIVLQFPKLSETFILNEVCVLRELGYEIVPISIGSSKRLESKMHQAGLEVQKSTVYVMDHFPGGIVGGLSRYCLNRPRKVLSLWRSNLELPILPWGSRPVRFLKAVYCASVVERIRAAHVHGHWTTPSDIAMLVGGFLGMPFSFTAHAHDIYDDLPKQRPGPGMPHKLKAARFALTCTMSNKGYIEQLFPDVASNKIHAVYHGLDTTRFKRPAGARRPDNIECPTIVSVGRMVWYKGFDHLVHACKILRDEGLRFRCLIVGDKGSQREPVQRLIESAQLEERVKLLGPRTQDELINILINADIFANASHPKGEFGVANVIVEGMAMELGVVATMRPQTLEYLRNEENALLVPPADPQALAAALRRLLTDVNLRCRLGREARKTVEQQFDIRRSAQVIGSLFDKSIRSATSRGCQ